MDWFARRLLRWFDAHGRRDLPWQQDQTPYRVWASEIMLQQTQVATVIPFYNRFITSFPTVDVLAAAELDDVLHHWTGLGYYARARNLHKAARIIVADHGAELPVGVEALAALPGIGRSTAGAIAAMSQGIPAPILDGNVKRVLARFHQVAGYPGNAKPLKELWGHATKHTPRTRFADYTQAIMDLGATICVANPSCSNCPVAQRCEAHAHGTAGDYPQRRPRSAKPVRDARMFLVTDPANACLLEQHPASGIWGGLWSPPQRDADYSAAAFAREFGLDQQDIEHIREAPQFRHTFTHFHLDIAPVHVQLKRSPTLARDGDGMMWFHPDDPERVGLSAPAVTLIESLREFELT